MLKTLLPDNQIYEYNCSHAVGLGTDHDILGYLCTSNIPLIIISMLFKRCDFDIPFFMIRM